MAYRFEPTAFRVLAAKRLFGQEFSSSSRDRSNESVQENHFGLPPIPAAQLLGSAHLGEWQAPRAEAQKSPVLEPSHDFWGDMRAEYEESGAIKDSRWSDQRADHDAVIIDPNLDPRVQAQSPVTVVDPWMQESELAQPHSVSSARSGSSQRQEDEQTLTVDHREGDRSGLNHDEVHPDFPIPAKVFGNQLEQQENLTLTVTKTIYQRLDEAPRSAPTPFPTSPCM